MPMAYKIAAEADLKYRRGGHINPAEHEQQLAALDAAVDRHKAAGLDI